MWLADIPGIGGVKCTFDHGGNWQPDNMTVGAQRKLADRRDFVRSRADSETVTSDPEGKDRRALRVIELRDRSRLLPMFGSKFAC